MKRNVPVKYSRELWTKTSVLCVCLGFAKCGHMEIIFTGSAIKRVEEIKTRRQGHFIRKRF
jgi:hypothetical protein